MTRLETANEARLDGASTSPSGAAFLSVESLTKIFYGNQEPVTALEDVDLAIREQEFLSIVGPSGCGKTTLLKILAGLQRSTSGVARLRGDPISSPSVDVGVVFQKAVLLPWRTIHQNVLLPIELRRSLTDDDRDRATDLLKLVGLEGFERRYPSELSGGMQQRASISRALIHDPALLLLDEPFGALDALTREEINEQLNRIWDETKKTAVLITHSIAEAVFLGTRLAVMSPRPGTVRELIDVPFPRRRSLDLLGQDQFAAVCAQARGRLNEDG